MSAARWLAVEAEPPLPIVNTCRRAFHASRRMWMNFSTSSREVRAQISCVSFRYWSTNERVSKSGSPQVGYDFSTLEIEAKTHLSKAAPGHLVDQAAFVIAAVEHE